MRTVGHELRNHEERREHTGHEDLGVREVDELHQPVDERVSDRDERVDTARRQSAEDAKRQAACQTAWHQEERRRGVMRPPSSRSSIDAGRYLPAIRSGIRPSKVYFPFSTLYAYVYWSPPTTSCCDVQLIVFDRPL